MAAVCWAGLKLVRNERCQNSPRDILGWSGVDFSLAWRGLEGSMGHLGGPEEFLDGPWGRSGSFGCPQETPKVCLDTLGGAWEVLGGP